MTAARHDLQQARSRICDMMLAASAVFAVPAVLASLYRAMANDWPWVIWLHIAAAVSLWGLLIFRKSIPYTFRAGSIVFIFLSIGLSGFWQLGMISGANPMAIVAPILATILFGKRWGIASTVALVLIMIITAYSFVYGGKVLDIRTHAEDGYLPGWITHIMSVILVIATSIAAISMSNRHLQSALDKSRHSETELATLNTQLEAQVLERTRELEAAKNSAEQHARTDALTGLNNRRAFFEYAAIIDAQARRYARSYVIAMIDIDHFKSVNDTFGHAAGDAALIAVGKLILKTLRHSDIVSRIGGEEFAVLMPETSVDEGMALANRLRGTIESAVINTPNGEISVTASIGIAPLEAPQSLQDLQDPLEHILTNADTALYQAKHDGRNTVRLYRQTHG